MNLTPNHFDSHADCVSTMLTINSIFRNRVEFLINLTLKSYVNFIIKEVNSLDYYKKKGKPHLDYLYNHLLYSVFEEGGYQNILSDPQIYWDEGINSNNFMNIVYAVASTIYTKTVEYFINSKIDIPFELLTAANLIFVDQLGQDIQKIVEEFNNFNVQITARLDIVENALNYIGSTEAKCLCENCQHSKEE